MHHICNCVCVFVLTTTKHEIKKAQKSLKKQTKTSKPNFLTGAAVNAFS